jgi:glycopeptide antibiotics resistance protein
MFSSVITGQSLGFRSLNIIPFITFIDFGRMFFISHEYMRALSNLLGNIAVFAPFGYLVALLFPKMRKFSKILLITVGLSLFIEMFQWLFSVGSADIDDILLNIIGGLLGYYIYTLIAKLIHTRKKVYITSIIALLITFSVATYFASTEYQFLFRFLRPNPPETFNEHTIDSFIDDNGMEFTLDTLHPSGEIVEVGVDYVVVNKIYTYVNNDASISSSSRTNESLTIHLTSNTKIIKTIFKNGKVESTKSIAIDELKKGQQLFMKEGKMNGENYLADELEVRIVQ